MDARFANRRVANSSQVSPMTTTTSSAYGSLGCVGVIVPPANVTVEPEMVDVMPRGLSVIGTRLPGRVSKETSIGLRERFIGYNRMLATVADSFGGARLSALGLACTGSCYLDGPGGDDKLCADLRTGGTQHVVTAAHALKELIEALGRRRIGLVTPYPAWVTELAIKYWQASGFEVVHALELPGVISIYDVGTDAVMATAREMMSTSADVILLSGTGVPTVPAIGILSQTATVPVISSNLALAWWMLRALGIRLGDSPSPALHALAKWLLDNAAAGRRERQDG
jgi:maleate isomerase